MDVEIKTWLFDILNAITEIDSFFEDQPKEFDSYINYTRTRRAVERNIEIIGEATIPSNSLIPEILSTPEIE